MCLHFVHLLKTWFGFASIIFGCGSFVLFSPHVQRKISVYRISSLFCANSSGSKWEVGERQWMMICGIVIFTTKVWKLFTEFWVERMGKDSVGARIHCSSICPKPFATDSIKAECDKMSFSCHAGISIRMISHNKYFSILGYIVNSKTSRNRTVCATFCVHLLAQIHNFSAAWQELLQIPSSSNQ